MWDKVVFALALSSAIISCKKVNYVVDPEDNTGIDTVSFVKSSVYISYNDSTLNFDFNVVTLNGNSAEQIYAQTLLSDSVIYHDGYSIKINSRFLINENKTPYSSSFLFDLYSTDWYHDHYLGVYLKRYFEITENDASKQTAIAVFDSKEAYNPSFLREYSSSLFANSSSFSIDTFYTLTRNDAVPSQYNVPSFLPFLSTLDKAIDSLIGDPYLNGERSITVFMKDFLKYDTEPTTEIDALVDKALNAQVKLNFIGYWFSDLIKEIAFRTGGFVIDNQESEPFFQGEGNSYIQKRALGVYVQNLDLILSGNVKSDKYNVTIEHNGSLPYFSANQRCVYPLLYNKNVYRVLVKTP